MNLRGGLVQFWVCCCTVPGYVGLFFDDDPIANYKGKAATLATPHHLGSFHRLATVQRRIRGVLRGIVSVRIVGSNPGGVDLDNTEWKGPEQSRIRPNIG